MPLIRLEDISLEFGATKLLKEANLSIEEKERICIIGRNGAGKTTMMKMLADELQPDRGEIFKQSMLRISQLQQSLPEASDETVFDVVLSGLSEQVARINRYQELSSTEDKSKEQEKEWESLQGAIESGGGWNIDLQTEKIISQLDLPANKKISQLSGGWRRRVALGRALVSEPDILLLDEPTNHLDITTIEWLEHVIKGYRGTVIFITHDRDFLQKIATRIVEIDRAKLISWPGNYQNYLQAKEKSNQEEDTANALFDKRLAEEENWIRQGIKARRTRNEGRVRALNSMREEYASRIKRQRKASIHVESAEKSGRKVCELRSIEQSYNGEKLINGFKYKLMRGDRIGLIGNNGVGKSTLLKIMLGQIEPDEGTVKLGTNIELGYFDQVKRDLNMDKSIAENVGEGKDYIKVNGKDRHVIGYLRNFLFSPKRCLEPVKILSGGEKNRVSLAKLFSKPCNLLILDEPTNDLDIEMLEVLEERLVQFDGTMIIVSHDRRFLDNVVTSVLVFEDNGKIEHYVGNYSDWEERGKKLSVAEDKDISKKHTTEIIEKTPASNKQTKKLSYKLARELELLPSEIDALESEIQQLQTVISDPAFYDQAFSETQETLNNLSDKQKLVEQKTARWLELEELSSP